jgi:ssDNA-binding Zn-finger/Zn-ribbon topoisomerase 1
MYQQVHHCPVCNGKLLAQTNRKGQAFWFCENRPKCKKTFSDKFGKPAL